MSETPMQGVHEIRRLNLTLAEATDLFTQLSSQARAAELFNHRESARFYRLLAREVHRKLKTLVLFGGRA